MLVQVVRNLILMAGLLGCSSCVTKRAADFLTLRGRANDGAFWEKRAGVSFQKFTVKTGDGLQLACLELPAAAGTKQRGTAYLFHGLGNNKEQMLPTAKRLSEAGFRCIAWDSRGHGKSEGVRVSYGFREADDALRVMEAARKRDSHRREPEVVWGYSMGTAVALQALPHMPQAKAAVLLAPIADLGDIIRFQASNVYYGAMRPLVPLVRSSVRSAAGFDPDRIRPVDAVAQTNARLLLIYGAKDRVTPPGQSQQILKASAPGQSRGIELPGVGHQGVMWDMPEKIRSEAIDFLLQQT